MGPRTHSLNDIPPEPAEAQPRQLEREIESLREDLDELVDELDRRRHGAFDVRHQLRRHPWPIALGAGALLTGVALAARRRRTPTLGEQLGSALRSAYGPGPSAERSEGVGERPPSLTAQLARTAALAAASVLVQRLTRRAFGGSA